MAAFVLIHSPIVGQLTWQPTAHLLAASGWIVVAPSLIVGDTVAPYWSHYADRVVAAVRVIPGHEPLVLVAHSAAGLLVPAARAAMAERIIGGYIFVDATLPRDGESLVELIPANAGITIEQLRARAENGLLPPWGTGWPEDLWRKLIPDTALRERFRQELRPVPLAFYEERTPFVPNWPDAPCSYVRFSALYADAEKEARRAGWRIREVAGEHLHMLVDPTSVVSALIDLDP